ncbi:MAG TPA: Hsp20/alpha crystallin family protein [Saprospiraceae bacterium]|nr:Hsp20/alpha crystallin family protein [Saprospiraceae bacterium]
MKPYACYPGVRARFQPFNVHAPQVQHVPFTPGKESRPAANIVRKDGAYEIQLAVPGFSKEQIRIEVIEGQLNVTATNHNQDGEKPKFLRQEFDASSFKRVFKLHKNANSSALKAAFDQGVLTIVIPDREPETIKIEIQ